MPKVVFGNVYVHREYVATLDESLQELVSNAQRYLPQDFLRNLLKIPKDRKRVTFSLYKDFDHCPHPELSEWVKVDLQSGACKRGQGSKSNPLILHRKETFVSPEHPLYDLFAALTDAEEKVGLLDPSIGKYIGRKVYWENLLKERGLEIVDHKLQSISRYLSLEMSSKTAIHRKGPSAVARFLVKKNLLKGPVFDWGCGFGSDIAYYRQMGFKSEGFDPAHRCSPAPFDLEKGEFKTVCCTYAPMC